MYDLNNLCYLCLTYKKSIISEEIDYSKVQEELQYLIPEHILHKSKSPKHVCNDCIENINNINTFRRKCVRNIAIYNEYVQKLSKESNSDLMEMSEILNKNSESNKDTIENESLELNSLKENKKEEIIENTDMEQVLIKVEETEEYYDEAFIIKENFCFLENEISESQGQKVKIKIENNVLENESGISYASCNKYNLFKQHLPGNSATNQCESNTISNTEIISDDKLIASDKCRKMDLNKRYNKMHRTYTCDVCGKTFAVPSKLKRHKVIHSGEKPFECDVCQKAFSQAAHLQAHKRMHIGIRPYACDVCQKTFDVPSKLKTHKIVHSGGVPYVCDVCQRPFKYLSNLNQHKRLRCDDAQV